MSTIDNQESSDKIPVHKSFKEFSFLLNKNLQKYERLKNQYEQEKILNSFILNNIPFGVIILDSKENIVFKNDFAEQILAIEHSHNWKTLCNQHAGLKIINLANVHFKENIEIYNYDLIYSFLFEINTLKTDKETIKLITFTNIKNVIDKKETEAWHNLSKVLTHEIMNSVTPLNSITDTITYILKDANGKLKSPDELENENISDIDLSISTLKNKTRNLLKFVQNFRELSKTPMPITERISAIQMINNVVMPLKGELEKSEIIIELPGVATDFELDIDISLTEQILQNIIRNAIQSFDEKMDGIKNIQVLLQQNKDEKIIRITDNGCGISRDNLSQVFIPFFTTKEKGSGIGLSIAKQLMELQNGEIQIQSTENKGTTTRLIFKAKD